MIKKSIIAIILISTGFFVFATFNVDFKEAIFDKIKTIGTVVSAQVRHQTSTTGSVGQPQEQTSAKTEKLKSGKSNNAYYQFTDKSGIVNFVDRESKVPEEYRNRVKVIENYENPSTRVSIINNQITVPVTFNNKGVQVTGNLTLDTGATNIVVYGDIAKSLKLNNNHFIRGNSVIADGSMVASYSTTIDSIRVGDKVSNNINIAYLPTKGNEKTDGLLGNDFLKHHNYKIDYKNHLIVWLDY